MKYYLIAGEASGDLHGANLMKGLLKADPQARFRFWGGDKMAAVGGAENLAMHYKKASFMGFVEIAKNLRTILGQIAACKEDVAAYRPDVLILIDYAGFNLRMAKFAKENGIPTYYYIAPKAWAWKESRVEKIRKYVDRLFVIFPFETAWFRRHGIEAIYEGNPLMDAIADLPTPRLWRAATASAASARSGSEMQITAASTPPTARYRWLYCLGRVSKAACSPGGTVQENE